jgi:hypothetical protein
MRDGYQYKTEVVFIAQEASRRYSNRRTFDSRRLTQVRCFMNRASLHESCIIRRLSRRPSKQFSFSEKGTQRCDGRKAVDMCHGLVNVYRTHHQPSMTSG